MNLGASAQRCVSIKSPVEHVVGDFFGHITGVLKATTRMGFLYSPEIMLRTIVSRSASASSVSRNARAGPCYRCHRADAQDLIFTAPIRGAKAAAVDHCGGEGHKAAFGTATRWPRSEHLRIFVSAAG
jgi:hypothetical protein